MIHCVRKVREMILSSHRPDLLLRSLYLLSTFVAIPSFAAPRLHCDKPKYDFGTVIGQEKITHKFFLTNKGNDPVKISNIKNCCGVTSTITPMEIMPGSNAVCKAVFTTRNRYGKQDKQILIATNDRKKPYFELKMTGTHQRPIEFDPRLVRLGKLVPDSKLNQTISLTNLLDHPVTLESTSLTVHNLLAEVIDDTTANSNRSWTIQLSSTGLLPVGKINTKLQCRFSSGIINIPVIGTVSPVLQATPDNIRFPTSGNKAVERFVMIRSSDGRCFNILSSQLHGADGQVDSTRLQENQWKLLLSINPESIQKGSRLEIKTSCPLLPLLEIPLGLR